MCNRLLPPCIFAALCPPPLTGKDPSRMKITAPPTYRSRWPQRLSLLVLATSCAGAAHVPAPANGIDYQPPLAEAERTQILVLATPHLQAVPTCLNPTSLDSVLAKLRAWNPQIIAIEALPAATIEAIEQRQDDFAEQLRPFAQRAISAAAAAAPQLALTPAQARKEIAQLLEAPTLSPEQHVRLVLLFAIGHEYPSAVLHWTVLTAAERAAAALPAELRTMLETSRTTASELYQLAVPLALQLGVRRLEQVDDFFGEEKYLTRSDQFAKEVDASVIASAPPAFYDESQAKLEASCAEPQSLLKYYQWMNDPAYAKADVSLQWGLWFRTRFPSGLDRARYAGWEARNLAIAANIRKESSLVAGKRVLVIYGAAHKPFLDAYLSQLLDVRVVSSPAVLGVP
jgi:Family of unknown function (DUF5694)